MVALSLACDPPSGPADAWDPAARALLAQVEQQDYRSWTELAVEGDSPHGAWSIIFTDATVDAAQMGQMGQMGQMAESWPEGSTLVCEGRDQADSDTISLQIMQRDRGGWLWAQYDAAGEPVVYGTDSACGHCHAAGVDFVRSLTLP